MTPNATSTPLCLLPVASFPGHTQTSSLISAPGWPFGPRAGVRSICGRRALGSPPSPGLTTSGLATVSHGSLSFQEKPAPGGALDPSVGGAGHLCDPATPQWVRAPFLTPWPGPAPLPPPSGHWPRAPSKHLCSHGSSRVRARRPPLPGALVFLVAATAVSCPCHARRWISTAGCAGRTVTARSSGRATSPPRSTRRKSSTPRTTSTAGSTDSPPAASASATGACRAGRGPALTGSALGC